jgi:cyclic pyranopterin phosphate synthase
MPNGSGEYPKRDEILSVSEIAKIARAFADLGVTKIRLTGGEPLIRNDIVSIAQAVSSVPGISDISMSTNGYLLTRHIDALLGAGVSRINVSLDSINPKTFSTITQGKKLKPVLEGLQRAKRAGVSPIKLNMVVMRGVNHNEIIDMIEFAADNGFDLRFIETMPIGQVGVDTMKRHVAAKEILDCIRAHYGEELVPVLSKKGAGPAHYYRIGRSNTTVGVISAVSRHFCEGCNRVRVSARGNLHLCLGDDNVVPLRDYLYDGDDKALSAALRTAILKKPFRHNFSDESGTHRVIDMSRIGG